MSLIDLEKLEQALEEDLKRATIHNPELRRDNLVAYNNGFREGVALALRRVRAQHRLKLTTLNVNV